MKYARRADGNQAEIVAALRAVGCKVVPTHTIGQGFPDLVISFRGETCLVEIKDPSKPLSDRRLTPAQQLFHASWAGRIYICETPEFAVLCATGRPLRELLTERGSV